MKKILTSRKFHLGLLLAVSILTHFAYFGQPDSVVFDEVHYVHFTSYYSTGETYFDIHPPLGKLIMAGVGHLFGGHYTPHDLTIGDHYQGNDYLFLRLFPLVAGTLLPLIIYLLAEELGIRKTAAFIAGLFVVLENSLLVESRLALLNPQVLFFGFLGLLLYFISRRRNSLPLSVIAAISLACALSIKWTAGAFIGLAGLYEIAVLIRARARFGPWIKAFVLFIIVPFIIYYSIFAIHFALLPHPGPGDVFLPANFHSLTMPQKFVTLNMAMLTSNSLIASGHAYASPWYSWPIMERPIYYWVKDGSSGTSSYIYLLGNPFLYWLALAAILALAFVVLIRKTHRTRTPLVILAGYLISFVPFVAISRVMFIYHYHTPLIFGILALVYLLDLVVQKTNNRFIWPAVIAIVGFGFIFFLPLTYGLPVTPDMAKLFFWFPSWR